MKIIDAHHHLWDLNVFPYEWLNQAHSIGDISGIRKNYLINDFLDDAKNLDLFKSVHIQCNGGKNSPVEETEWLQSIANIHGFPHGIVFYTDLLKDNIEKEIEEHCKFENTRGLRYLLNYDSNNPVDCFTSEEVLINDFWKKNYAIIKNYNLSFDVHLWPQQYYLAYELFKVNPSILNIINHAGTPKQRDIEYLNFWKQELSKLASLDNTAIKISGLGMFDQKWTTETIRPIVMECIEIFGIDRCFFATNFPVDKLFSSYEEVWKSYFEITKNFSDDEKDKLYFKNAEKFYRI